MAWCENNDVDFLFGLAKNARLNAGSRPNLPWRKSRANALASRGSSAHGLDPWRDVSVTHLADAPEWSRERRVVAKAEWTAGEANPRFVVTSLAREEHEGRHLYEKLYCARGEMENRIKESSSTFMPIHLGPHDARRPARLWFASMAYVLICALRRSAWPIPSSPVPHAARSASSS